MSKIMILGAGIYQVPLIQTAKHMGLTTLVASIPGDYPGFPFADKSYEIDTTDREGILQICRQEQVDGICTSGTDVAVSTIGYVCSRMGLPGLSERAASLATDKAEMKAAFRAGGVCASDYRKVTSFEEAKAAVEELGYPVIIKRVDSSGSRGISKVTHPDELLTACELALQDSQKPYFLVEEVLTGTEIGVDGLIQHGKLLFLAPHEKTVYHAGTSTIPSGHAFPWRGNQKILPEITRQMHLAVSALGLDNCSFNADVFVDNSTVSVIEIGGRTGATCIPELISLHYDFDFYQSILNNALGKPVLLPTTSHRIPCMARLLMSPISGQITAIDQKSLDLIQEADILVRLDFPVGHPVQAMKNGTTRIGHVIAKTESEDAFTHWIHQINRCIWINDRSLEELWQEKLR